MPSAVTAAKLTEDESKRRSRALTPAQTKVRTFLRRNHGMLAKVARDTGVSIQFVSRIAYNQTDSQSRGLRVEHALLAEGLPLIQKVR